VKRIRRARNNFSYDVCLSFAGEDRPYVSQVAQELQKAGIRVFYDSFEEKTLWGKDLYEHLDHIYSKASRFCVMFCSKHYARKLWTNHERKSAQARAFEEHSEYILPARFDRTEIPGIRKTVGYVDLKGRTPEEFAGLILDKLRPQKVIELQHRKRYLPVERDILLENLKCKTVKDRQLYTLVSHLFFESLCRLSQEELYVVLLTFTQGCAHDLPRNVHIALDLLRRITQISPANLRDLFGNLQSVGFHVEFKRHSEVQPSNPDYDGYVYLEWGVWSEQIQKLKRVKDPNFTGLAHTMLWTVQENYCSQHGIQKLLNLNFSDLSKQDRVIVGKLWCA
jgi:hypothetical protein